MIWAAPPWVSHQYVTSLSTHWRRGRLGTGDEHHEPCRVELPGDRPGQVRLGAELTLVAEHRHRPQAVPRPGEALQPALDCRRDRTIRAMAIRDERVVGHASVTRADR